ncbi:MAG: DUF3300 domain-containing protein [Gammaproteobacteria bacterium]|jgi:hypothetical protein
MKDTPSNRSSQMTARVAGVAFIALLTACSGKKDETAAASAAAPAAEAPPVSATDTVAAAAPAAVETAAPADASVAAPPAPPEAMTPAALEELLAPIALYPDALLGPLLTAATHPQEVMDGGNYLLQTKLTGKELDADAEKAGFGPSTRALLQFPTVVDMMCQNFDWTQQLGSAMNTDQTAVLAAVQRLRTQAVDAGSLKSTPQQKVSTKTVEKQKVVVVEPAEPTVVYVPQYDPQAVYQPAATAAPAITTTTTTTTTAKSGPTSGDVAAAGIFGFAAGLIVANAFDDDDRYPYPYPNWGYGGMYYGGSAWYGGGYVYRPNYGYGGYGGYRPGYGYRPPVNYPNAWNRPGSWTRPPVWTRPGINNNNVFINVNNQNNYYNRFDDKRNLRVADSQRPQLVSPKVRTDVDRSYRPPSRPMPAGAINSQGRPGGMQPGERRDERADWKGQSGYQGARPAAAGAGAAAVGGKVPQNVPKISDRDVRDKLPASGQQRPMPQQRPAGAQQRPAVADRPGGAQRRPAGAQRPAARPEQRPMPQQRPAVERPMPQQRPAMERPMSQQRPAMERPMPQQRPAPQQRPGADRAAPRGDRQAPARQREGR